MESQLVCLNQLYEGFNSLKTLLNMPIEAPNLVTDCPIKDEFSSLGGFQIDGLSPRKMAKVREVLSSLDIKCIPSGRADSPQVFETCSIWLGGLGLERFLS